jgi:hypothetical protein
VPRIEYVTLSNHAEAHDGLLYLSGAGWTDIRPQITPEGAIGLAHFGIGLSVLVGWNETNQRFPLVLQIFHEDGGAPFMQAEAQIEQGRPPGIAPGQDLRSVLAVNVDAAFPQPGGYEVRATIADQAPTTVSFRVVVPARTTGSGPTQIPRA